MPGLGRWLEYTYPTNLATKMFCHDQIIHSVAGGQQGCPLMIACHAVVQCLLLESLGAAPPLEGSSIQCLCCPLLPGSTSPHVLLMMAYLRALLVKSYAAYDAYAIGKESCHSLGCGSLVPLSPLLLRRRLPLTTLASRPAPSKLLATMKSCVPIPLCCLLQGAGCQTGRHSSARWLAI